MAAPNKNTASLTATQITDSFDGFVSTDIRVPTLTVLAHPEVVRIGERALLPELKTAGGQVSLSRIEPHFAHPGSRTVRSLDSVHLSRKPVILNADGQGSVSVEQAGSSTPVLVEGKDLAGSRVLTAQEIEDGAVLLLGHRVVLLLHLDTATRSDEPSYGMVGESFEIHQLRREIGVAGRLDVPVLLRGESGTGKEISAKAVHDAGPRADQGYIPVNMAAIPGTLAASELFGAVKGAYTGADRRKEGFFQRANGGTLFLDEIGETPGDVQPLLLRALENGEIQPVGSSESRRVDVRLIAATDADLENAVSDGTFRGPLLHRLAGYEIQLPPLRQRRSDFGRLLFHFLRQELERMDGTDALTRPDNQGRPWPAAGLVARLARCSWPGNIRQLKNVARRMVIARMTDTVLHLDSEQLGEPQSQRPVEATPPPEAVIPGKSHHLETQSTDVLSKDALPREDQSAPPHGWRPAYRKPSEVTEKELLATLRDHQFELKATAEALGISRASLYSLVEANPRIRKANDLDTEEVEAAMNAADGDLHVAAVALEVSSHGFRRKLKALGLDV